MSEPTQSTQVLPDVALLYHLMDRGTILPDQLDICIAHVREGFEMPKATRVKDAQAKIRTLWDLA